MDPCVCSASLLGSMFVLEGLQEVRRENKFTLRSTSADR